MLVYSITQLLRREDKPVELEVVFKIKFLKFTDLSLSFLFEMIERYLREECRFCLMIKSEGSMGQGSLKLISFYYCQ